MLSESFKGKFTSTEIGIIPNHWELKKLQHLAKVTGGKRLPKGKSLSQHDTGHPYIRVSDMEERGISLQGLMYVPLDIVDDIKRYRVEADDLYISVAGTIGLVGEVPKELDGANLTENADRISEIQCDRKYLLWVLRSELVQKTIKKEQTSNAQPKLALTRIKDFLIPIPPQSEQQKIASILNSVDKAIEKTEAIIEQTEEVKKGLMQQLLTKGIGHTKFKKTEVGEIPEEWSISRLEDITTRIGDGIHATPKYDSHGEIPFVNGNNIRNRKLYVPVDNKRINEDEYNNYKQYLNENTILLSINGTIGKLGFYNGEKVLLGKSIAYINPNDKLLREYLFYCLGSYKVQNFFLRELTGTTIKNLSLKTIRDTLIPVPTIDEQKEIASILTNSDKKVDIHKEELAKLLKLKQGLMQSLLTGKVRVKVDEAEVTQV